MKIKIIAFDQNNGEEYLIELDHWDLLDLTEGAFKLLQTSKNKKDLALYLENCLTFATFEQKEYLVCENKVFFSEFHRPHGSEVLS